MFSPWRGESDKGEEGSQVYTLFRLPCHPAVFVAGAFFDGDLSRREGRGSHLLAAAKDHQMARQEIKRCRAEIACQGLHLWSLFRCIALPSCAFCVRSPFSAWPSRDSFSGVVGMKIVGSCSLLQVMAPPIRLGFGIVLASAIKTDEVLPRLFQRSRTGAENSLFCYVFVWSLGLVFVWKLTLQK